MIVIGAGLTAAAALAMVPRVDEKPTLLPAPPPTTAADGQAAQQSSPPPPPAARARSRPQPPATQPARVYRWKATPGAVHYHVSFVRNGRQFYDAQTIDPTLRLPNSLKFPPGTYRWSVRPAVVGDTGIVVGEAVLSRTFRVGRG